MCSVNAKNKKCISKINGVNKYTLYCLLSVFFCLSFPSNLAYSEQTIDSASLEEFTDGTDVLMAKKMPAHRTKVAKQPRSKRVVGKPQAKRPGMRKASNIQKKNKSARSKYKSNGTKSPKYKKSRIGKNQKKIKPQRRVKPKKAVAGSFRKNHSKSSNVKSTKVQKSQIPKYLQKKVAPKYQNRIKEQSKLKKTNSKGGRNPKSDWAKMSGQLRDASRGKGNFNIGTATKEQANAMGKAWVGKGYTVASDGKTLVSKDGLRQYRPPTYKPKPGKNQANFEQRPSRKEKGWITNAHLDILN